MIELYRFKNGNSEYYYTSSNNEFTVDNIDSVMDNVTFLPRAIKRKELNIDGVTEDNFEFIAPISLKPLDEFIYINPNNIIWVYLYNEDGNLLYVGQISDLKYNLDKHSMNVKVNNIVAFLSNNIPKYTYSSSCSFDLFDEDCSLNRENYKVVFDNLNYTIDSNLQITIVNTETVDYFNNGYLIIDGQNNFIISHNDNIIKLLYPIKTQDFSGDIEIYPGCNKNINNCLNKFNNLKNFGGFPFVPKANPFQNLT